MIIIGEKVRVKVPGFPEVDGKVMDVCYDDADLAEYNVEFEETVRFQDHTLKSGWFGHNEVVLVKPEADGIIRAPLPVDKARLYFLLALCNRDPGGMVARNYVAEKAKAIWRCEEAWQVRALLDDSSRASFDAMIDSDEWAPVVPR